MRVLILLALVCCALTFADSYYVEDTTGTGLSSEDAIAVQHFVRNAVTEAGHQAVMEKEKSQFQLRPKLIRLGRSYILTVEKRTSSALVYSTQMKAAQIEELDDVASRVTRACLKGVPARGDEKVGDVTEDEETRGMRRRPAKRGTFVAFGPAAFSHLNATGLGFYGAGAYAWDVNRMMVRLRVELAVNGGAIFTDFGLGASYFLSDRSFAPFVGLDLGFGFSRIDQGAFLTNETISGFILGPTAGFHVLRTHAINLEVAAKAAFLLKAGSLGTPVAYILRVGLYF